MGTSMIGFIEIVRTLDRVGSDPTAMQDLLAAFAYSVGIPVAAPGDRDPTRRDVFTDASRR